LEWVLVGAVVGSEFARVFADNWSANNGGETNKWNEYGLRVGGSTLAGASGGALALSYLGPWGIAIGAMTRRNSWVC
jgi:hypothetical protein